MIRDIVINEYFNWLVSLVCENRYSKKVSYTKLLTYLHKTIFKYSIPKDQNRAEDGIDLRYRFALMNGYEDEIDTILDILKGPCSIFEMMVGLSIRCEETIMDDPDIGDRRGQWFWEMVVNLGLGSMYDSRFNRQFVDEVIQRFLNREYEPNGKGGLFTVKNSDRDLRTVEIWYQLCWYLDEIM